MVSRVAILLLILLVAGCVTTAPPSPTPAPTTTPAPSTTPPPTTTLPPTKAPPTTTPIAPTTPPPTTAPAVTVAVGDYARWVRPHSYFNPVWKVEAGDQKVEETGVVWGNVSGNASMEGYPSKSVGAMQWNGYSTSVKAFPDTRLFEPTEEALIYFRAYAVVGGKAYFSNEEIVHVYRAQNAPP